MFSPIEFEKCQKDIVYFAEKYVCPAIESGDGSPIELYEIQKDALRCYQNERWLLINASRQVGKSLISSIHALWKALFFPHQTIGLISQNNFSCELQKDLIKKIILESPTLCREVESMNSKLIRFRNNSDILFHPMREHCIIGRSYDHIDIQEPSLSSSFLELFRSVLPIMSSRKNASICLSGTKRYRDDFFYKLYLRSFCPLNEWKSITINWNSVPRNKNFEEVIKNSHGDDTLWESEYLTEFSIRYPLIDSPVEESFIGKDGIPYILCEEGLIKVPYLDKEYEDHLQNPIYNSVVSVKSEISLPELKKIVKEGTTEKQILEYYGLK